MGGTKEVSASANIGRVPFGLKNEKIAPGIDALVARLLEQTGILPRHTLGAAAIGIKQIDPHKE
jgi:hypothetical protein